MTILGIEQQKAQLDDIFELIDKVRLELQLPSAIADRLQSNLTQYLCVRVSGFIEVCVRLIYQSHAVSTGASTFVTYVGETLERQPGPNSEYLFRLTGRFDPQWESGLRTFLVDEYKEAVDSVVRNRHKIAHGEPVTLGHVQLKDWYKDVLRVVEFLSKQAGA